MEDLKHKYENFKNCYEDLGRIIIFHKELESMNFANPIAETYFDAGVVKQFELTYETAWKFLKKYLEVTYNREVLSPKAIFRACEEFHLFEQSMLNELITLADARNETTHIYNRLLAQEVCDSIEKHYKVFGKILEIIQLPQD
jgi:nucleotidyltransferase substrate binding protein (TIGR01987 family)